MRCKRSGGAEIPAGRVHLALFFFLLAWSSSTLLVADPAWRTLPEMETPDGVVVDSSEVREALSASSEGALAAAALEELFVRDWPSLRTIDWLALSRYQRAATEGWEPPESPGPPTSRVLGRDSGGRLHVEVRGPRLPALYDIVYRYIYAFGTYDPLTREVRDLVVTIRGWVEE